MLFVFVFSANVGTSSGHSVYEDRDTFYTALTAFLEEEDNTRFVSDIVYNDNGEIKARGVWVFFFMASRPAMYRYRQFCVLFCGGRT